MITKKINFTEQQIEMIHFITEEPEFGAAVRQLCKKAVEQSGHKWKPIQRRGKYKRKKLLPSKKVMNITCR
jgi:hypothetical protein